jgi:oligopeptide transport system substrate-binding protein
MIYGPTKTNFMRVVNDHHWDRILFAILLSMTAIVTACDTSDQEVGSTANSILHRGNGGEPDSLDPHRATGIWEGNIVGDLFIGLYTANVYGNVVPGLAESHSVSKDGLVYTFNIREGLVWSDGVPMTAHDFVYSLGRIFDPKTAAPYASLLYSIKNAQSANSGEFPVDAVGARAINDHTLEITLERPTPFFIELTSHMTMFPVPKHVIEEHGPEWVRAENMVVIGPYLLAEWVPQSHVKMVKNKRFYDAANVKIDEVFFYPTVDAKAALKQFRAGELDITLNLPLQQIDWLKENLPDETRLHPYIAVSYIVFNTERAPFDDIRVRTALSMAIDRSVLTDKILKAGQTPALTLIPPGISNYSS